MHEIYGKIAAILLAVGFIPYIWGIWQTRNLLPGTLGKIEPKKVTWLLWSGNDATALLAMLAAGTANWQIKSAVFLASSLFILSLLYGTKEWTKLDAVCLILSIVSGGLWYAFNSPTVAIVMSMSILCLGTLPTAQLAWNTPENESLPTWVIFNISSVFGLLAVTNWTNPDCAAQPVTFMAIDALILGILLLRRNWSQQATL